VNTVTALRVDKPVAKLGMLLLLEDDVDVDVVVDVVVVVIAIPPNDSEATGEASPALKRGTRRTTEAMKLGIVKAQRGGGESAGAEDTKWSNAK
jgi:hypothetical protein